MLNNNATRKRVKSTSSNEETSSEVFQKRPPIDKDYIQVRKQSFQTSKQAPWFVSHSCSYAVEAFNKEVLDFYDYIKPTKTEHAVRSFVVTQVEKIVNKIYPSSKVVVFGSYNTKLYLPTSDIDLVIVDAPQDISVSEILDTLADELEDANIATNMQVIHKAKVPIIKYIDKRTHFSIDISVNLSNGIQSAKIMTKYIKRFSGLKELVIIIKHFFYIRGLNEVYLGGIGSYTITLMVTSFMQLHPQLQNKKINPMKNLGVLLIEFFELYGKAFNYKDLSIRVHKDGAYLLKSGKDSHSSSGRRLLSIQDPQDPENDVSKGSYNISQVQYACLSAFNIISSQMCQFNRKIKEMDTLNQGKTTCNESFLLRTMGVKQDFISHREFIKKQHDTIFPSSDSELEQKIVDQQTKKQNDIITDS